MAYPALLPELQKIKRETFGLVVTISAAMMENLSLVLQQKMGLPIRGFGQFWKIKPEIYGWVRGKQVSAAMMEILLFLIRNINISLYRISQ